MSYLIQEALATGKWTLVSTDGGVEEWARVGERITISKNLLRSTEPPSVVFDITEPEIGFQKTDSLVINSLSSRLAKPSKMSAWYDKLSTTKE